MRWDTSHRLTQEQLKALPQEQRRYAAKLGDILILMQPPARYMNHSCDPNTQPSSQGEDIAIRDIAAGEEITSDYGFDAANGEQILCSCGSPNCKRMVAV